jgi:hypothetical protein
VKARGRSGVVTKELYLGTGRVKARGRGGVVTKELYLGTGTGEGAWAQWSSNQRFVSRHWNM